MSTFESDAIFCMLLICFAKYDLAAAETIYPPILVHVSQCSCFLKDIADLQATSPSHPIHFQWDLDLENMLTIKVAQYLRCLVLMAL
ncbi:hypothetical protein TNCV_1339191 [Trichonephila clavipes]|uniref:Uncharacterized protein n=1 Tax=Trichonephila clavipes TaxID=2585209 RepID=A0A8X6RF07_TRICX|nr:hypothetical protein TNCV_1339191 [Trichonephila clavipes]